MNITERKAQATLNKLIRYEDGTMTRREYINKMRVNGCSVKETSKPRIKFNRSKYNRMDWHEQQQYERKCEESIPCFELIYPDGCTMEITKAEFDYFNNIQLSEDLRTEQMNIAERIEAGIATDEEINGYENEDFEFFNKYGLK